MHVTVAATLSGTTTPWPITTPSKLLTSAPPSPSVILGSGSWKASHRLSHHVWTISQSRTYKFVNLNPYSDYAPDCLSQYYLNAFGACQIRHPRFPKAATFLTHRAS